MSIAGANSRCLLLVPRGHEAPLDLIEGLRRRRVRVQEVNDPPAVMVALATAAADPGPERSIVAVVIVEPAMFADAEALAAAVRRHHGVALWRYSFAGDPRLSRLASTSGASPAPAVPPEPALPHDDPAHVPSPTVMREAVKEAAAEAKSNAAPPPEVDEDDALPPLRFPHEHEPLPTLLSEDELAMLLGHDRPSHREGAGS